MPGAPKPPLPKHIERKTSPNDVSVSGARRAPAGRILQREGNDQAPAELETVEQTPERGSDDARLLADSLGHSRDE